MQSAIRICGLVVAIIVPVPMAMISIPLALRQRKSKERGGKSILAGPFSTEVAGRELNPHTLLDRLPRAGNCTSYNN
jgi:hypothetical protein